MKLKYSRRNCAGAREGTEEESAVIGVAVSSGAGVVAAPGFGALPANEDLRHQATGQGDPQSVPVRDLANLLKLETEVLNAETFFSGSFARSPGDGANRRFKP